MKRFLRFFLVFAGISFAVALGGRIARADEGKECAHWQEMGDHDCHCKHRHDFRHQFRKMAAELGLSEQQKAQVKEIFRKGMAGSEPIMTRLITERRNLRALVQADKIDEAAIRAQAAKLADIEGDLAIQRARMAGQIRAILTPAQVEKFKACQLAKEKKFDNLRERMHRRFENITTSK